MSDADVRRLRASRVSMVYQNPTSALNPTIRIGDQVAEVFTLQGVADERGRRSGRTRCSEGADLRPRAGHAPLPAPALGRHEPARGDRHGARQRPHPADPRRAHHGPRRHGRGGGARPRRRAARGVRFERDVHQPQPRRDPPHVRPRGRAVRRAHGRAGAGAGGVPQPPSPLHRRPLALHPSRRGPQGPGEAGHDSGLPAGARGRARGLRVHRPLRARPGHLPPRGAGSVSTSAAATAAAATSTRRPRRCRATRTGRRRDRAQGRRQRHSGDQHAQRAQDLPPGGPRRARRGGHHLQPGARARRSGWSASRAAARPRWPACSSGSRRPTRVRWSSSRGTPVAAEIHKRGREEVRAVQIVFQNPDAALNRRFSIQRIIARALHCCSATRGKRSTPGCATSPTRCASTFA